jgi:ribosomal protein S18 acetylase RimI-like enzyme
VRFRFRAVIEAEIALRTCTKEDREFVYEAQRAGLREYVIATWGGWKEEEQRERFLSRFSPGRFEIVTRDGADVGFVEIVRGGDQLVVGNIELVPRYQRQGIGTVLLRRFIGEAAGLPVRLQVLRVNPARSLYERLGFLVVGETETHFRMERPAG